MKFSYKTDGTCSKRIDIEVESGILVSADFIGGCSGNSQGVAALVKEMPVAEVVRRLKGIACQGDTSCPDQLARALEASEQMK
ncbi:TIGR03905 family TSCPD domain-containing protein [Oryzomonas japonica]|uniref:ribonucleoside-diphosphate reductase n=1 Tax=Oryzomonas japonica TaxID=2603858 RepID=A0A7J4ZTF7_9BACT|nr:TIGR03905 family TSCPD domain-containing protein [Oryzomonas japonica]KAB0666750.1 TIGR03905 family TSCPD domain-containing protein [Oryzomonas japonica]